MTALGQQQSLKSLSPGRLLSGSYQPPAGGFSRFAIPNVCFRQKQPLNDVVGSGWKRPKGDVDLLTPAP